MKRAVLLLGVGFLGGFVGAFASPGLSNAAQEKFLNLESSLRGANAAIAPAPKGLAARVNALVPIATPAKNAASSLLVANLTNTANAGGLRSRGVCPNDMVGIEGKYCIDRYEAGLVEIGGTEERAWPHNWPVDGHNVRAVSKTGIFPQSYISGKEAATACKASGKRLCRATEWKQACQGPQKTAYPYGQKREPGKCNDAGKSPISRTLMIGGSAWSFQNMNQPSLTTLPETVAPSGTFQDCVSGYGVHDMVGNVHEWVDDQSGSFAGGYFQDVELNGPGCSYKTVAHQFSYHDYSTGFRCCADAN